MATTFRIPEMNFEKFEKKMAAIQRRCERTGSDFSYEIVGYDTDSEVANGHKITYPVTIVEVSGTPKMGDYSFIASIDHYDNGNVIRAYDHDFEIPERFHTAEGICEHCGTRRARKYTFLVSDGKELHQVGKSCLKEYTGGISAEQVAEYMSYINECESFGGLPTNGKDYIDITLYTMCAIVATKVYGFHKSTSGEESTRTVALKWYNALLRIDLDCKDVLAEMRDAGIEIETAENRETAEEVLDWCKNYEGKNEFRHNLRVIAENGYLTYRYLGLFASAYYCYAREVEKKVLIQKREKATSNSTWIGEVGDSVSEDVTSWRYVTASVGFYGTSYLYEFITKDGNILNWWTQKYIEDDTEVTHIKGRIKELREYKGRESTLLTYCRLS